MAKKEFTFRGKSVEELQALPVEEFAKLCNSRQRRTLKRVCQLEPFKHYLKKIRKARESLKAGKQPKPVKTHSRDFVVVPEMVGVQVGIYKGNEFALVDVKDKMLGHFLGEFVLTRKRLVHGKAGIGATRSSTAISER
ncbi:30S ribosomal protein S19 [uncultured archaeon]|nr:30S ribosomal protein S19 [uncultured archaeon]